MNRFQRCSPISLRSMSLLKMTTVMRPPSERARDYSKGFQPGLQQVVLARSLQPRPKDYSGLYLHLQSIRRWSGSFREAATGYQAQADIGLSPMSIGIQVLVRRTPSQPEVPVWSLVWP